MTRQVCFVGHSHKPLVYQEDDQGRIAVVPVTEGEIALQGRRVIVNAGSVGTPRTPDRLGSVVVYDTEKDTSCFTKFPVEPSFIPDWIARNLDWPDI